MTFLRYLEPIIGVLGASICGILSAVLSFDTVGWPCNSRFRCRMDAERTPRHSAWPTCSAFVPHYEITTVGPGDLTGSPRHSVVQNISMQIA